MYKQAVQFSGEDLHARNCTFCVRRYPNLKVPEDETKSSVLSQWRFLSAGVWGISFFLNAGSNEQFLNLFSTAAPVLVRLWAQSNFYLLRYFICRRSGSHMRRRLFGSQHFSCFLKCQYKIPFRSSSDPRLRSFYGPWAPNEQSLGSWGVSTAAGGQRLGTKMSKDFYCTIYKPVQFKTLSIIKRTQLKKMPGSSVFFPLFLFVFFKHLALNPIKANSLITNKLH